MRYVTSACGRLDTTAAFTLWVYVCQHQRQRLISFCWNELTRNWLPKPFSASPLHSVKANSHHAGSESENFLWCLSFFLWIFLLSLGVNDVDTDNQYEQDARRHITQHVKRYGVLLFSSVQRQEGLTIQDLYTFHKHTIIHPFIRLPITHSLFFLYFVCTSSHKTPQSIFVQWPRLSEWDATLSLPLKPNSRQNTLLGTLISFLLNQTFKRKCPVNVWM